MTVREEIEKLKKEKNAIMSARRSRSLRIMSEIRFT